MDIIRKKYFKVGMGGTFDHFHEGHAKFLRFAAQLGAHLVIGVTDSQLTLHKPFTELIEPYSVRSRAVHHFCNQNHIAHTIVKLFDQFGPTLENSPVRALVVTPETTKGADKINEVREKLQLPALPVYICDYFLAEDGQPLHAEHIRSGKANRAGQLYSRIFEDGITLNNDQRLFFQKNQGLVITSPNDSNAESLKLVVGDVSLRTFISNGWKYDMGIYDHQEQRLSTTQPETLALQADVKVNNPAGAITLQLIKVLQTALDTKQKHIFVEGEEDLAAVALVLLAPLNTQIYYGQPGVGLVEMIVIENLKETFSHMLQKTSPPT